MLHRWRVIRLAIAGGTGLLMVATVVVLVGTRRLRGCDPSSTDVPIARILSDGVRRSASKARSAERFFALASTAGELRSLNMASGAGSARREVRGTWQNPSSAIGRFSAASPPVAAHGGWVDV